MKRELFPLSIAPSLVRDFVSAHQTYTEAPDEFLAIAAIYAGSVLAGRWVEFNGQFLNNYYLIVGPTGTAKKTTAQALSMRLLREVKAMNSFQRYEHVKSSDDDCPPEGSDTAYPLVTHFSVEGLQTNAIGEGTSTAIQMGEYGSLFEIGKRQSQGNTISELTNMYDGNLISVKTVSRKVSAENYAISILAGSTESWLGEFCSGRNISGGFVNRHLVVTGRPCRILPKPELPSKEVWKDLVERFNSLVPDSIHPEIESGRIKWIGSKKSIIWSSEAEKVWGDHYRTRTQEIRSLSSPLLNELSARELTHATKVAGLSAFLDGRMFISIGDLEFGLRLARWSVQNVIKMITVDDQPKSDAANRVLNKLTKSGAISKTDLARSLGGSQKEINKAIAHMVIDGIIEDCPDGLLRFTNLASNSQREETEKYFSKINTSEFLEKEELGVEQYNSAWEPVQSTITFSNAPTPSIDGADIWQNATANEMGGVK